MNKKTIEALNGSISKWKKVVDGTGKEDGAKNCPLCNMFLREFMCDGCPVKEFTGKVGCNNTPYTEWVSVVPDRTPKTPEHYRIAQKEVDFLKSLLPKKEIGEKKMELKIEKDKVEKLAKQKPEMRDGLKILFPEVFVEEILIFKCGDLFSNCGYNMLVQVGSGIYNFINLENGNRWYNNGRVFWEHDSVATNIKIKKSTLKELGFVPIDKKIMVVDK
jgi:hypothetical protein